MATSLARLPAMDLKSGNLNGVIDTPKNSRNKYKFDDNSGQWRLSKILPQGMSFPSNFGFVPSTQAEDGDPVDVLVFADEPCFPGCVVPARLIGVLEAEQTQDGKTVRNERLIAVVETPSNPAEFSNLEDVNQQQLEEIEHFFVAYNEVEGRHFKPLARKGPEDAQKVLQATLKTFRPKRGQGKRVRSSHP
jgi:inorganic pyrophosphatase